VAPEKVSPHVFRHSFASHAAENGVPRAVIAAILGDNADIVDHYYTHIGDEALQDAVMAISGKVGVLSPQERINQALEVLSSQGDPTEIISKAKEILTKK